MTLPTYATYLVAHVPTWFPLGGRVVEDAPYL